MGEVAREAVMDDLARAQVAQCQLLADELDRYAVGRACSYIPGDAPCIIPEKCIGKYEVCSDGTGLFDIWHVDTMEIFKGALTLDDVVAWIRKNEGIQ